MLDADAEGIVVSELFSARDLRIPRAQFARKGIGSRVGIGSLIADLRDCCSWLSGKGRFVFSA